MAAENVVVGPWGGQGGNIWSYIPKGPITRISITYGDIIDSIRFTSLDEFGYSAISDQFGSSEGSNKAEIEIDAKDEKLRSISGTFGVYNNMQLVTSLSFTTDKDKSYGPFGSANGSAFSFEVEKDSICGFHGRAGVYLDAIGVYVNPAENLVVGPWGGQGGNAWSYIPKGPITRISITYGDIIDSIRFTSLDESGNFEISDQSGSSEGSNKAEIEIDAKDEKLSSISGTFGAYNNMQLVTSLSFTTDKEKSYGPFGSVDGSAFSFKVTNESIYGFHGCAGVYLDAIGVYVNLKVENVVVGPWGGQGGNAWSYLPKGPITRISITYGDIIDSIRFESQDESGHSEHSDQFGSNEGSNKAEIVIDAKVEKLSSISGTFGWYNNMELVSSLSFATDTNNSYGLFGSVHGGDSSFKLTNESIVGFHGQAGVYLDAFGVYLKPKPVNVVAGPWGGQGGQPWSYAPKGTITCISITYGDIIDSIRFTSQDESGHSQQSDQFGSSVGSNKAEIKIDAKDEKLNSISGTFGLYNNMEVVSSLSFTTDKGKSYGPFGINGIHVGGFLFKVTNKSIYGFHGRAGVYLDAIGVYGLDAIGVVVEPTEM